MSAVAKIAATASPANPPQRRLRPWRLALDWLASCLARHHSRQDLSELSPYLRRDLGLTDAEVAREVQKPCWRR